MRENEAVKFIVVFDLSGASGSSGDDAAAVGMAAAQRPLASAAFG
jgi:hypothetical protein